MMQQPTSEVPVESSLHGRLRRAQRMIEKRDLQAAVRHGKRERTWPDPKTRKPRYKYTYSDVVYITDETSTKEVTSYVVPLEMNQVAINSVTNQQHTLAKERAKADPRSVTSHTVLVVDHSRSMGTADVVGDRSRLHAVYYALGQELVAQQLAQGGGEVSDVVSLIEMRDTATLAFEREPLSWVLFNQLARTRANSKGKLAYSHGNYVPALTCLRKLLQETDNGACAILVLFLSDGRPSDVCTGMKPKSFNTCLDGHVRGLCCTHGKRLTFGAVGFAAAASEFAVLDSMVMTAKSCGNCAFSLKAENGFDGLRTAISTLATSLANSRVALSTLAAANRTLRDIDYIAPSETCRVDANPDDYDRWTVQDHDLKRVTWSQESKQWEPLDLMHPAACGIAVHKKAFGHGAERVAFFMQEIDSVGRFVGEPFVAKESRFVEDVESSIAFHKIFLQTQRVAANMAVKFNRRLEQLEDSGTFTAIPRVSFIPCWVYMLRDKSFLAEKRLDLQYKKWNDNAGGKTGAWPRRNHKSSDAEEAGERCDALQPSDDAFADDDDDEEHTTHESATEVASTLNDADVPQAFTHFTYRLTQRRRMVCDLQGVLDRTRQPPVFELTDPCIHYSSRTGRKMVFGRTDQGQKGMHKFFKSHTCNPLCVALGLARYRIQSRDTS